MPASEPIVCHRCLPKRQNWNEPCPCVQRLARELEKARSWLCEKHAAYTLHEGCIACSEERLEAELDSSRSYWIQDRDRLAERVEELEFMLTPDDRLTASKALAAAERRGARKMREALRERDDLLLNCYQAGHREGWEEGPANSEVMDRLHDHLANIGRDPAMGEPIPPLKVPRALPLPGEGGEE